MSFSPARLRSLARPTRRLILAPGDVGAQPVTKVGGTPWWPAIVPRPRCEHGHQMSFLGQVLLQDVPGRQSEKGLVSLHYCLKCSDQEQMSFGRGGRYRGYAVTIFDDLAAAPDGLGTRARSCLPALVASLSEVEEFPGLHDCWELGIELPDAEIEGAGDLDEEIWPGVVHVARSKLGGWPSWDQDSQWPECSEGKRMGLVMQLDYELGRHSPWAAGGHAFLFGCESACRAREADLVIQTT